MAAASGQLKAESRCLVLVREGNASPTPSPLPPSPFHLLHRQSCCIMGCQPSTGGPEKAHGIMCASVDCGNLTLQRCLRGGLGFRSGLQDLLLSGSHCLGCPASGLTGSSHLLEGQACNLHLQVCLMMKDCTDILLN